MNNKEKFLAAILALGLVAWMFYSFKVDAPRRAEAARLAAEQQVAVVAAATNVVSSTGSAVITAPASKPVSAPAAYAHTAKEEIVLLSNEQMEVKLSSWGAIVRSVRLKGYNNLPGAASAENTEVVLGGSGRGALRMDGVAGLDPAADYQVVRQSNTVAVFTASAKNGLSIVRRVEILPDYKIAVRDTFRNSSDAVFELSSNTLDVGYLEKGTSANDMLSVDSFSIADDEVVYWGNEKESQNFLAATSGGGFGCGSSSRSAAGLAEFTTLPIRSSTRWLAVKNRFFVSAAMSNWDAEGFEFCARRDMTRAEYRLSGLSARLQFAARQIPANGQCERITSLFIGPKKLSMLQKFDSASKLDEVMEFGMWSWLCKLLVPTLNGFYALIPNYGIAILLLTVLVRVLFWPLTHKSTESMKKMSEIQPKIKELQARFKDNPQKLQQETWAIYRENKVNPMASCLPMLVQIPVFIALFYVLRNSVELRYAPFLWISDLSEPENLLAGILPIPLNILPILMAVTMGLQSYFTPSAGDPKQQRMMMVMMPVMMLFMFYSFPSALSLYWTVSQVLAIVQMVLIRRKNKKSEEPGAGGGDDRPLTRQQRRHA